MNGFQRKTLDRLIENEDKLNTWELGFVEGLDDYPDNHELSFNENHKLNELGSRI